MIKLITCASAVVACFSTATDDFKGPIILALAINETERGLQGTIEAKHILFYEV